MVRTLSKIATLGFLASICAVTGCRLFVDVSVVEPAAPAVEDVAPLTAGELLAFTFENLGDVSPGLAYRSAEVDTRLLEFLETRCKLGHIFNMIGSNGDEQAFVNSGRAALTSVPMSHERPPSPAQILELIRITHRAREDGRSFLIHCKAGADRTGVMVAVWRMLFQGVTDRDALKKEALLFGHISPFIEMVKKTIDRFRPELFLPFVEDPALLDDTGRVAELESRYFDGYPLLSGDTTTNPGSLHAGTGKVDLLEGLAEPVQMATYGPSPGFATGVREPVFARALLLDNGGKRTALVSCDLMIMDSGLRAEVLRRLEKSIGIDDLLLCTTHTHTSVGGYVDHPTSEFYILGKFNDEARSHLVERIVTAVENANEVVEPARIGFGRTFVEDLSYNRRIGTTVDPAVGIMKLVRSDGSPLALVVNFAGHPVLEPADGTISADYPGILTRKLDERFGFGLFLGGALGDVNAQAPGAEGQWITEGLAQKVATRLFDAVEGATAEIDTTDVVKISSMTMEIDLPPMNVSLIPDLFLPLDWAIGSLLDWPRRAPLQAMKIGPAAIVACSTEAAVRVGLQIKRRSPSPHTFVVTHANGYAGYAVTQVNYSKSKRDPTSMVLLNGSTYGRVVVERACDLLAAQWGTPIDVAPSSLPTARDPRVPSDEETLIHADTTLPQSRRRSVDFADSMADRFRLEVDGLYLEDLHGGTGLKGRRRELSLALRALGPWDLRFGASTGYLRSDWNLPDGAGTDEGVTDLFVDIERPFVLASDDLTGTALRVIPWLGLSTPTGNPEADVPFAFAASSGVWRPTPGTTLELTWETYRRFSLQALYSAAVGRHAGRQPGDLVETAIGYGERHGNVSLFLDLTAAVQLADSRNGGRRVVDVSETSFHVGLRPGLTFHWFEAVDLFVQGRVPLLRGGSGGGGGVGMLGGVTVGF